MTTPTNQLALPGPLFKPNRKRVLRNGTVILVYPSNAQIATIAGKWRRLPSGELEATYTREELELCERAIEGE
jgi:hypothetical protein